MTLDCELFVTKNGRELYAVATLIAALLFRLENQLFCSRLARCAHADSLEN